MASKSQDFFAHAQDKLNLRMLRIFEGTFSLDMAKMIFNLIKENLCHIRALKSKARLRIRRLITVSVVCLRTDSIQYDVLRNREGLDWTV